MSFAGLGAQKSARRIDQSGRTAETGAPLQRSTRAPSQEQRNNTGGQNAGVGISERPTQTAAGTVRKIQAAEPAARQLPRAAGVGSLNILASMSLSRPVRDVATERGAS